MNEPVREGGNPIDPERLTLEIPRDEGVPIKPQRLKQHATGQFRRRSKLPRHK
jgi:hypothetical protein